MTSKADINSKVRRKHDFHKERNMYIYTKTLYIRSWVSFRFASELLETMIMLETHIEKTQNVSAGGWCRRRRGIFTWTKERRRFCFPNEKCKRLFLLIALNISTLFLVSNMRLSSPFLFYNFFSLRFNWDTISFKFLVCVTNDPKHSQMLVAV